MLERLAVLVDGDNISPANAEQILEIAQNYGAVDIARVYLDAQRSSDWHSAIGYRLIHAGTGKNASDLLLSIDAMELATTGGIEKLILASSDGDFTHLAQRLREHGLMVVGIGEPKAPKAFRAVCTDFAEIRAKPDIRKFRQWNVWCSREPNPRPIISNDVLYQLSLDRKPARRVEGKLTTLNVRGV